MNIHFDDTLQSLTKQTLTTLNHYSPVQVNNKPTHMCGHIIDWVVVQPDNDIHKKSIATDSLESDHYCIKFYFNVSVSKSPIRDELLLLREKEVKQRGNGGAQC